MAKEKSDDDKQVFLTESELLSDKRDNADFEISVEDLTAKLAEKKDSEEEKVVLEVGEDLGISEVSIQNSPKEETFNHYYSGINFFQRHKWLVLFTVILVASYFVFHPAENISNENAQVKDASKQSDGVLSLQQKEEKQRLLKQIVVEGLE